MDEDNGVLTEEELLEQMEQRGMEKLVEHQRFISFNGTISTGNMSYEYGKDFFLGDYVTVYSSKLGKYANLQITSVTKSISNGVEHLDITFGTDRLKVAKLIGRENGG